MTKNTAGASAQRRCAAASCLRRTAVLVAATNSLARADWRGTWWIWDLPIGGTHKCGILVRTTETPSSSSRRHARCNTRNNAAGFGGQAAWHMARAAVLQTACIAASLVLRRAPLVAAPLALLHSGASTAVGGWWWWWPERRAHSQPRTALRELRRAFWVTLNESVRDDGIGIVDSLRRRPCIGAAVAGTTGEAAVEGGSRCRN
jgi:hypothetical protein